MRKSHALLVSVYVFGCGGGEIEHGAGAATAAEATAAPASGGSLTIASQGAIEISGGGDAEFWTIEPTGAPTTFVLNLHPRQPDGARISFMVNGGDRPAPGTYRVVDTDDGTNFTVVYVPVSQDVALSEQAGTVTITESSPTRIEGTYDITAAVWRWNRPGDYAAGGSDAGQARITGSFTAICNADWSTDTGRGSCR